MHLLTGFGKVLLLNCVDTSFFDKEKEMGLLNFCGSQKTKGRRKSPQVVLDPENHLKMEPMRVPNDAARFDPMSISRCRGQRPKYKNVRRGHGRPIIIGLDVAPDLTARSC